MDETADVLLAYKMNGKDLSPDHGYPIRLIVPGYIGGRMVRSTKRFQNHGTNLNLALTLPNPYQIAVPVKAPPKDVTEIEWLETSTNVCHRTKHLPSTWHLTQ